MQSSAPRRARGPHGVRLVPLLLLVPACYLGPPIGVEPVPTERVREQLERSALTGDVPSAKTAWLLRMLEAEETFEVEPRRVLHELEALGDEVRSRALAFVQAELAFLAARRLGDRDLYLASAVYAHRYLLGELGEEASPWDRRHRWACELYNTALGRAFRAPDAGLLLLEGGRRELPFGEARVEVDTSAFPFPTEGLELLLADELRVDGLDFRVRDSGLGAPLIAVVQRRNEGSGVAAEDRSTRVPATAFLDVRGSTLAPEGLVLRLSLHSTYDAAHVTSGGREVPLEADLSATLAADLEEKNLWRFDIPGFFKGDSGASGNGLLLPRPYEPGRIPVVLVHGTASNPSYWADLMNALTADPALRGRFQFWLFLYSTGNPIAFSAATLREELEAQIARSDPEGEDGALRRMVLVGHSQGGLLVKMAATSLSAEELCRRTLNISLAELELAPDEARLVQRLYDVEPLPFVERVVFVATPHRGSFLAGKWYARLAASLVSLPGDLLETSERIFRRVSLERVPSGLQPHVATSLDNMRPDNPVLRFLAASPVDPRIPFHSIIPIGDAEEPGGADDGVVEYESAHLELAASEVLVPSSHSCQAHPRTIVEMRRILRVHAGLEAPLIEPVLPDEAAAPAAGGEHP